MVKRLKKMVHKWQIRLWKDAQHHESSGKWTLKPQWVTTTYSLQWIKFKSLKIPNIGVDVEQLKLSYITDRNV